MEAPPEGYKIKTEGVVMCCDLVFEESKGWVSPVTVSLETFYNILYLPVDKFRGVAEKIDNKKIQPGSSPDSA